jgi:transposase-like protein
MLINIKELVEERLCYEKVRELRWAEGVKCPHCTSQSYKRHGHHNSCEHRYQCKNCHKYYDDLTMTVFEGHHQPLKVWILCLYFMGLNLSNTQIAKELDLNESDIQIMCNTLRSKTVELKPSPILENEVEIDEVYIVSGHKGNSQAVKKKIVSPDADV